MNEQFSYAHPKKKYKGLFNVTRPSTLHGVFRHLQKRITITASSFKSYHQTRSKYASYYVENFLVLEILPSRQWPSFLILPISIGRIPIQLWDIVASIFKSAFVCYFFTTISFRNCYLSQHQKYFASLCADNYLPNFFLNSVSLQLHNFLIINQIQRFSVLSYFKTSMYKV